VKVHYADRGQYSESEHETQSGGMSLVVVHGVVAARSKQRAKFANEREHVRSIVAQLDEPCAERASFLVQFRLDTTGETYVEANVDPGARA
jgi:hypothetical protein